MANTILTSLTELTSPATGDHLYIVDISNTTDSSAGSSRRITLDNFTGGGLPVGVSATQTLTNKTLTSPVISTIVNTGTLTLPTSTDTLIGRATTDTLTNKTLTSPKVGTAITDTNGNEIIKTPATTSAVNEITVTNAATGNAPELSATGGDADIDLKLTAKGTGKILQDAHYQTPQTYSPSAAATATLDLSTGNEHRITMPAGNITIAISNETNGQKFIVSILQDGSGSRTVTWFSTIRWADGVTPTLTTTASKRDVFGFIVTGTDTYDGFIVGQNI